MMSGKSAKANKKVVELEKQEWNAGKVIAVKMADHHRIDRVGALPLCLEGGENAGAGIEQHSRRRGFDEIAGVVTAH